MNKTDPIAEVGIDEQRRLYLRPSTATFPYIYREALEVHWDSARNRLYAPPPREWTHLQWFQHIISTAALQSYDLYLTPLTEWINIPAELGREMQHWLTTRIPEANESEQKRAQQDRAAREQNYQAIQEPRLKAHARELFYQGRYSEVVRIESQIKHPEFLSPAERQLFVLARKRQEQTGKG